MRSLTHHPIPRPLYSRSWPHERRNMRSVWPVGAVWGCLGRQTSSPLTLNGHASRVNTTTYDYLSNAVSVHQHGNAVDEIFAEFEHNANGLLTSIRRYEKDDDTINEIAESLYEYNSNNAVTSITHNNAIGSQIVKHSYTYDETNNIVEYLNSIDGNTEYNYDFLGQLISADHASQTDESYAYDSNGNRIVANGDAYTTGTNNELTSDGDYTYTYDAEGNRTSKTNSTNRELYTWDYRNRLTSVTQQEWDSVSQEWSTVQIVEYAYDYNNIWIRKVVGDSKTIFIPEAYQTTAQIDNGTVSHHYLWTPNQQDKLLADTTSDGVSWSLTDHLGTIRDVLSATTTHLIYDAFGNLTSGTNPILFGYTGKAFDTDTHLQNNINRWYDANIGRWLSTDPIGFNGNDTNLYRYVGNIPIRWLDHNGLKCSDCGASSWDLKHFMFGCPTANERNKEILKNRGLTGLSPVDGQKTHGTYFTDLSTFREGQCGRDITDSLRQMRINVENLLSDPKEKCAICSRIFKRFSFDSFSNWDIDALALAGKPGRSDFGATGDCAGTVTVNGHCYWAAEVNYFLYGLLAGICDSENILPYMSYESKFLTAAYRGVVYGLGNLRWFSLDLTPPNRSWGAGITGRLDWIRLGLTINSQSPDQPPAYIQGCTPCKEKDTTNLLARIGDKVIK